MTAKLASLLVVALAFSCARPCREDAQCNDGDFCDLSQGTPGSCRAIDVAEGEGEGEAGEGEGEGEGEGGPVQVAVVDTGIGFACILEAGADAHVQCFGNNQSGQLGRITEFGGIDEPPARVPGLSAVEDLAVAQRHTCVIGVRDDDDDARTVVCFGDGTEGSLGQVGDLGDALLIEPNLPPSTLRNAVDVDTDGSNNGGISCVVDDVGEVFCWGPLMPGYDPNIGAPVQPAALQGADAIFVDEDMLCANVPASGGIVCTNIGNGSVLQLGCTDDVVCPAIEALDAIYPSNANTCVIDAGDVFCAGENDFGVVNPAARADVDLALTVVLEGAIALGVGTQHACALESDGRAVCWGRTLFLSTGYEEGSFDIEDCETFDGTRCHAPLPVPGEAEARRFSDITTRNTQSCAREFSGEGIVCWGNDKLPFRQTFTQ
jgi:alpha-tubulin suppressor-like RCC1 family protein